MTSLPDRNERSFRTSENDPLRVDFLSPQALPLPGRLGMTIAPGKRHIGMYVPWHRDLDLDLARLRDHYNTQILVSLIESHEFEQLQIPDLLTRTQQYNLQSRWFPIPDFNVPASMTGLIDLVQSILEDLGHGKTVVVHCKGGLGRSGLVAGSVLVTQGYSPSDAFAEVRKARPGSIETSQQEAYVAKFAQVWHRV